MNHPTEPLEIHIDGILAANVGECRITKKRDLLPVGEYSSDSPSALVCRGIFYEIELTRVEPWRQGLSDGLDFGSLDHFQLEIRRGQSSEYYEGCRISEQTRSAQVKGAYEQIRLLALTRRSE